MNLIMPLPQSHSIKKNRGRLRIGNDWNAITIIALSQNDPLKAIAEFVENSIDAKSKIITIIRGREKGEQYLKVVDDGNGIPQDSNGIPDFQYVATHAERSHQDFKRPNPCGGSYWSYGMPR